MIAVSLKSLGYTVNDNYLKVKREKSFMGFADFDKPQKLSDESSVEQWLSLALSIQMKQKL